MFRFIVMDNSISYYRPVLVQMKFSYTDCGSHLSYGIDGLFDSIIINIIIIVIIIIGCYF